MAQIGCGYGSDWHLMMQMARRRHAMNLGIQAQTGCGAIVWLDFDEHGHEISGSAAFTFRR